MTRKSYYSHAIIETVLPYIRYIHIDGSTPQHTRDVRLDEFKKDVNVAVLSLGACSTGLSEKLEFLNVFL